MPRIDDNGARAKSGQPRTIPTSTGLVGLYATDLRRADTPTEVASSPPDTPR